jgi:hypothetical protein
MNEKWQQGTNHDRYVLSPDHLSSKLGTVLVVGQTKNTSAYHMYVWNEETRNRRWW